MNKPSQNQFKQLHQRFRQLKCMKPSFIIIMIMLLCIINLHAQKTKGVNVKKDYFPDAGNWIHQSLKDSGIDSIKLQEAIHFAIEHEAKASKNMELSQAMSFGKEPFGEGTGPFSDRGDPTGVIVYKGYIVAEWGAPSRVDMTHSVTKSFLSTVVGLAVDEGLIKSAGALGTYFLSVFKNQFI